MCSFCYGGILSWENDFYTALHTLQPFLTVHLEKILGSFSWHWSTVKEDLQLQYENLTLIPVCTSNLIIICPQVCNYSQSTVVSGSATEMSRPCFLVSFFPDAVYGLFEASTNWMHESRWVYEKYVCEEEISICFINTYLSLLVQVCVLGAMTNSASLLPFLNPTHPFLSFLFPLTVWILKICSHVLSQIYSP